MSWKPDWKLTECVNWPKLCDCKMCLEFWGEEE